MSILYSQPFRYEILLAGTEEELDRLANEVLSRGWKVVGNRYFRLTRESRTVAQLAINTIPDSLPEVR